MRVVYEPSGGEAPGFYATPSTRFDRIVIGSQQAAAAGGKIYVQFPLQRQRDRTWRRLFYGRIDFADGAEADLFSGPRDQLYIHRRLFNARLNAGGAFCAPLQLANTDTLVEAMGQFFPAENEILLEELPDLIFDGGSAFIVNMLGGGDGDDSNDVEYRAFSFRRSADSNELMRIMG